MLHLEPKRAKQINKYCMFNGLNCTDGATDELQLDLKCGWKKRVVSVVTSVSQNGCLWSFQPWLFTNIDLMSPPPPNRSLNIPKFAIDPDLNLIRLRCVFSWLKRLWLQERLFASAFRDSKQTQITSNALFFSLLHRCDTQQMRGEHQGRWVSPPNTTQLSRLLEVTRSDCPLFSFITCWGLTNTVFFLCVVPLAQKLSGKGNPPLWCGSGRHLKGKYLQNTHRPLEPSQTLHPRTSRWALMSSFFFHAKLTTHSIFGL